MTSPLVLAFALAFGAGPLMYLALLRQPTTRRVIVGLGLSVLSLVVVAGLLRERAPAAQLVALWLAWVSAVAFVAHMARARARLGATRTWILRAGLMAVPVPWFGLAMATEMSG